MKDSVILAQNHHLIATPPSLGFFQETQTVGFSPIDLWNNMGWLARGVCFVLFIMSIWSLAVMIDRYLYFNAARKQSREFAPRVAGALKEGKLDEAVKVADRNKKSHLAEVVTAGLQEFRNYGGGAGVSVEQIESSKRALERAEAIVHAKLKRGLGSLATIGSTAPFVGLFGTVAGILKAFQETLLRKLPASALSPAVFLKPWSPRPSGSSWLSRRCGSSTTSPTAWKPSTSRWTTPPANSSITSSSRVIAGKREGPQSAPGAA